MNLRSNTILNSQLITLQDSMQKEVSKAVKYLSIWLDTELIFDTHYNKAVAKAGTSLEALQGLAGSM